ncbi:LacI family DNA-binding transcriptional regulator [uncultured Jannaschia sp.]|uniref:LacI family DNA-binding transcriptional regulator n=1 Tax=uncultured Jannaschia sp. TaxID=293347 RepID=UPI0026107D75|nr:LacI family DNA-binding transcriptional regulator [uncultured Jannaschia sp.]
MENNAKKRQRPGRANIKLEDVAIHAGVSPATVSRFLNNPKVVSEEAKKRIKAAIATLGYMPHRAARALASNHSRTIGAVVPTLDNAIFSRQIMAFQNRLAFNGYTLLLAVSEYDADSEFQQARVLLEHGVEALMLVGERRSAEFYSLLTRVGVPFVNTWLYRSDSIHPCCGFIHDSTQQVLVDHLVGLGHRRLSVITGQPENNDRVATRLNAIVAALESHGLDLDPRCVINTHYSYADGREALRRLMALDEQPTAVLAGNDVLASGVLFEAHSQGIDVPGHLSVTGFGDLAISEHLYPPLTTIRTPKEEIGEAAADFLIARLAGRETPDRTELPARFCLRASTGPAATPALAHGIGGDGF